MCDDFYKSKSILIIEKDVKDKNDRTWSSWVKLDDPLNEIATMIWPKLNYYTGDDQFIALDSEPYHYRMIRSADYYRHCHNKIGLSYNISIVKEEYSSYEIEDGIVKVYTDNSKYEAKHVFTSIYKNLPNISEINYVDQHFKGWFIECEKDEFKSDECHFMDFRTPQNNETRFLYVLPLSSKLALVQVAIFSNNLLSQNEYNEILSTYISEKLKIADYKIVEEEYGVIPMTTYDFSQFDNPYITHIGTAAGCVKPSSGYAFTRIQRHAEAIADCLKKSIPTSQAQNVFKTKYKILDDTMLDVINKNKISGEHFFTTLFQLNKASDVFDFLNESSSFSQEIKIMNLPFKLPFIKSFVKSIYNSIRS
jgi:lycopene beta-cyclase